MVTFDLGYCPNNLGLKLISNLLKELQMLTRKNIAISHTHSHRVHARLLLS